MKWRMLLLNSLIVIAYFLCLLAFNKNQSGGDISLIVEFIFVTVIHLFALIIITSILKKGEQILIGILGIILGVIISIIIFNISGNHNNITSGNGETISIPLDSLK